MGGSAEGTDQVLLEQHGLLWNQLFGYIKSMCLKCAVELGVPDAIHSRGGAASLPDLVETLGVPVSKGPCLRRLMRLLVHAGFFTLKTTGGTGEDGEDDRVVYLSTDLSNNLLRAGPASMSDFLLMVLDPLMTRPYDSLSRWFHENEATPFELVHGECVWDVANKHPKFNDSFNKAMAGDATFYMNMLIKDCAEIFDGLKSLVDVGGGTGSSATIIASAFPDMKCIVLDLPHVTECSPKDSVVEFIGGNMFQSVPQANAVLLKWILHNWDDENCVKILKCCKQAIPTKVEGGKVIVIDMIVDDRKNDHIYTETQYYFDLQMMVNIGGLQRNENQWRKIFKDAGFSDHKVISTLGLRSVIEVYP